MDLKSVRLEIAEIWQQLSRENLEAEELADMVRTARATDVDLMSRSASGSAGRRPKANAVDKSIRERVQELDRQIVEKNRLIEILDKKLADLRVQEDNLKNSS